MNKTNSCETSCSKKDEADGVPILLVIQSFGQSDLEVSVERLASQGNSVAEHGGRHQTDRLPVHHEPVLAGERQAVSGADALHPPRHLRPGPGPRVRGQLHLLRPPGDCPGALGEPGDGEPLLAVYSDLYCGHHHLTSSLLLGLAQTDRPRLSSLMGSGGHTLKLILAGRAWAEAAEGQHSNIIAR